VQAISDDRRVMRFNQLLDDGSRAASGGGNPPDV
jgi:hypothetical protein